MQEAAVAYLEQVNSDSHDLYKRVTRAALWMESTCNLLNEARAEVEAAYRMILANKCMQRKGTNPLQATFHEIKI